MPAAPAASDQGRGGAGRSSATGTRPAIETGVRPAPPPIRVGSTRLKQSAYIRRVASERPARPRQCTITRSRSVASLASLFVSFLQNPSPRPHKVVVLYPQGFGNKISMFTNQSAGGPRGSRSHKGSGLALRLTPHRGVTWSARVVNVGIRHNSGARRGSGDSAMRCPVCRAES